MKLSLAFMTGVLAMAAVVYVTGARLAAPMFFAGAVAVAGPSIALLSSVKRLRSFARFLTAFADSWEGKAESKPMRVVADRSAYVKPSPRQREQITRDTAAEYLNDDSLDDIFAPPPVASNARRAS